MFPCCSRSNVIKPSSNDISNTELMFFDENDYDPVFIAEGASSKVYRITINNTFYTCKKMKLQNEKKIQKEIDVLKSINGIRLPYFHKYIKSNNHYILYNFIEGKDLFYTFINNKNVISSSPKLIAQIIYEIAMGLNELFKNNYVHLDLKPENIIISNLNPVKLKIIDLAYCKKINNINCKASKGTYGYASPEIMIQKKYYHNSDIWSLGIIMFSLIDPESFTIFLNLNILYWIFCFRLCRI